MGPRGIPPEIAHLPYLNPRAILLPGHPTSYLGAHHRKGIKSLMRRNSLISSRLTRALRNRPATDTRLLPPPFPTRRWKVHRPHAAHLSPRAFPRLRHLNGVLTPGHRPGGRPDTLGSPEATAPRLDSPVASLGTAPFHGDGKEYTPDPLRRVESVWGSYPFQDSPLFPLGDPCSPRDGRESALPSLRMVERLPHTDRPELPSSPADMRVWRSWPPAPAPWSWILHRLHPLPVIPDPDRDPTGGGSARPERSRRVSRAERSGIPSSERGTAHTRLSCLASHSHPLPLRHSCGGQSLPLRRQGNPSLRNNHLRFRNSRHPLPFHQYQTRGSSWRRRANCSLCFSFPLSLKGPKGEGEQGGEGSPVGLRVSPLRRGDRRVALPPATREIPRKPFRRRSIKTATRSINVQSKSQPHNRIETRCVANPPHGTSP